MRRNDKRAVYFTALFGRVVQGLRYYVAAGLAAVHCEHAGAGDEADDDDGVGEGGAVEGEAGFVVFGDGEELGHGGVGVAHVSGEADVFRAVRREGAGGCDIEVVDGYTAVGLDPDDDVDVGDHR